MKTMKKIGMLILMVFALTAVFCFVACEKKSNSSGKQSSGGTTQSIVDSGNGEQSAQEPAATLVMSSEMLNIEEDDTFTLTVSMSDNSEVGAVVWTSSDESVATVAAGTVTAISEGTATITATAGALSATCAVTVYASEEYPIMELSRYNVVLLIGDESGVTASATYKGNAAAITSVTATSANEDVVTVAVDGTTVTLTAVAYGETTVTVSSSYKNKDMSRNISVKVNEDVQLTLDETAALYTYAYGEYESAKQLTAAVTENGNALENPAIVWSCDDDTVVTVDNGTITAAGIGEATVTAKYVSASGIEYTKECVVTVSKTVVALGTNTELYLNAADGDAVFSLTDDLNAPALSDLVMTNSANGEEIALTPAEGGYTVDLAAGCYNVTLSSASANAEFTAELTIISKVIRTLEELDNLTAYGEFTEDTENKTFTLKGFFVLGADIDATGYEFSKTYREYFDGNDATLGLVGGFDGKGHTIYGGTYYKSGLFGQIAEGSIVRNLAINNATLPYENAGGPIAKKNYGTIDNCLVEVTAFDHSYCAMSAVCRLNYGTISNCVTSYPLIGTANNESRAICEYNYGEIINVYAITDDTAAYNAGGGTQDVKTFSYATKASDITFTGLSAYFDMSGDSIAFYSLADLMVEIEANKEAAAQAYINGITEETIEMHNGSDATLLDTIEYTAYELTDLDEQYADLVTMANGKVTVSESANEDFTFGVKYYYTKDAAVCKTVTYSVVTTDILTVSVDLFLGGDMTFDVSELGLTAGTNYALALEDGTPVAIEASGAEITVSGLAAGEYTAILNLDGSKYQFNMVVITEVIATSEQLAAFGARANIGYYILGADVDASYITFMNVNSFTGTFDGRGYAIFGGTYVAPNDNSTPGGLFGKVNEGSVVKNITLLNCAIKGEYSWSAPSPLTGRAYFCGTLCDAFIEITEIGVVHGDYNNTYVPGTSMGVVGSLSDGVIKNVTVYNKTSVSLTRGVCDMVLGTSSISDTCVVGPCTQATGWNQNGSPVSVTTGASISEEQQAEIDAWYKSIISAAVTSIEIANTALENGDEITLPALPANVNWSVTYADAAFDGSVAIGAGKLSVNAVKVGSFNFTLTATYAGDASINKSFDFTVSYIVIVNKPVELLADGDMTVNLVDDLGVTAGSEYTLKEGDDDVAFTANGNIITLSGLEAGEHGLTLTVDGAVVKFKAIIITEVITTAQQLAAFAARSNEGYYVLGDNVDATDLTFMNTDATFTGTFDGRGYTIANATFSSENGNKPGGLFGTVETGATVKNLAIIGATLTTQEDYNWVYTSILTGGGRYKGTLEQCYIEIVAKGSSTHAMGITSHTEGATIKNVILKSVSGLEKNVCDMVLGDCLISNVYVIGGSATNNGWNQNGSPVSITSVTSLSDAQQASFDASVFGFKNGIPYFLKYVAVKTIKTPFEKTLSGGVTLDFVTDLGVAAGSGYMLKNTVTDTDVPFTVDGTTMTLTLAAGSYNLTLTTDEAVIKFKVVVITEIITTADQLAAFAARSNDGYYVLGANVDATGLTFMNTDATFTGTFDGRGYTIANATFSSENGNKPGGLFGTVETGATVKNLAIIGATLTTQEDYNWVYTSILTGGGRYKGTLEQCYIEIVAKGSSTHAMGITSHTEGATIKNVILKSVSGLEKNVCDMVLGDCLISNVYVIGGSATNNGWNQNGSPVSITSVTSLSDAQQASFDASVFGFKNGIPYFLKYVAVKTIKTPFEKTLSGGVTLDFVTDLGVAAGSGYMLKNTVTDTDVPFTVDGTTMTLTLAAGSYNLTLTTDEAVIKFKVVVDCLFFDAGLRDARRETIGPVSRVK